VYVVVITWIFYDILGLNYTVSGDVTTVKINTIVYYWLINQ